MEKVGQSPSNSSYFETVSNTVVNVVSAGRSVFNITLALKNLDTFTGAGLMNFLPGDNQGYRYLMMANGASGFASTFLKQNSPSFQNNFTDRAINVFGFTASAALVVANLVGVLQRNNYLDGVEGLPLWDNYVNWGTAALMTTAVAAKIYIDYPIILERIQEQERLEQENMLKLLQQSQVPPN